MKFFGSNSPEFEFRRFAMTLFFHELISFNRLPYFDHSASLFIYIFHIGYINVEKLQQFIQNILR